MAQIQQVSYLTADHLGSPRITTNENGGVTSRKDFMAYGDEVISSQRTSGPTGNGYSPPNLRQDYTGYEKDAESGLEFAQARYYSSTHGRFTSADPLTASATIKNPQSFNRYTYTLNSPYKFTDPLGLLPQGFGGGGGFCSASASSCSSGESLTTRSEDEYKRQQATPPQPPPPPIDPEAQGQNSLVRQPDEYCDVAGQTADVAYANSDVNKINSKCQAGYAGCTLVLMTDTIGHPGATSKKVKGGYEVTESPFAPSVNGTATLLLPNWTGYKSASQTEKSRWDARMNSLKDHEEGHVDIASQELKTTNSQLSSALPGSRTFFSKSGTLKGITAAVTARYQMANQVARDGYSRFRARDTNYDLITQHGRIPRNSVQY